MGNIAKKAFPVLNMHCAGCANNVEKTVKKLPGVVDASVNFASNTLTISYEDDKLTPGEIRAAVLAAGYDLIVEEANKEERREEEQHKRYLRLKRKVIGAWIFVVPLLIFSMLLMHMPYSNEIQMLLAIPVMVLFGGSFFTGAWKQAKIGRSNMDTLVALSTSIAFLFSLFNTFFPQFWTGTARLLRSFRSDHCLRSDRKDDGGTRQRKYLGCHSQTDGNAAQSGTCIAWWGRGRDTNRPVAGRRYGGSPSRRTDSRGWPAFGGRFVCG